ncbi:MAG: insulinase family protein, partial [Saprospiraceae bacterium]
MQKILVLTVFSMALLFACSPKTGDKMNGTDTTATTMAPGKAPHIPIPMGDVRKSAPKAGDAPRIQVGRAQTFKLDNGLTVIVVENHKLPTVAFRVFVDNDPILEKDAAGYVQLMGELLTKGTKTRSKAQIDQEIDFIGASLASDPNGVSGSSLTKHANKLLDLMSDVLLNPTFPEEELEKAKRRQESALAQQKDDANAIASNVAAVLRYTKNHPYGEIMTEATLARINLDQIKGHYATFFKPNISYLVVTGDITRAKAEQFAKQYFSKWQRGLAPKTDSGLPRAPEKTQVDFVSKPGAVQSVINISYPVELQPGTPDVIRGRLANAVLGGYFNSRVNANLREGHGWTYGARTSLNPDILVGSFSGTASVRNAVTDSSIIEFMQEMNRLHNEKVPAAELQVVKNVLSGQFSQSLEEPGTVANFALSIARYGLPADYYEKYLEVLQAVSAEEVQAMARKYIRPEHAHILVVGNMADVADRLKQFSPDGTVNFYDFSGNPLKPMSAITVPAGMTAEKVIDAYINAIGGISKISAIKDLQTTAEMKTPGPQFAVKTYQKGGNKILVDISMNGNPMSKQIYDGQKGVQTSMGQSQPMAGQELGDIKEQAMFAKEASYQATGYKLSLKGAEDINGSTAYVVEVERPDGKKSTDYYDMKTGLKLREVSQTTGADGQPTMQMIEMSDYQPVNGVMIPRTMSVTGLLPVPVKIVIKEIKANAGVDDAMF